MAIASTILAQLKLDVRSFNDGLASAQGAISATGKSLEGITKFGKGLTSVGTTLTKSLTLPIVAVGAAAVKTGVEFESAMSKVAALSGATGKDLQSLEDIARRMGSETAFSATEAAEGLQYMALAGWDTNQMLKGLEPVLKLAGGAELDLATTSDIVTDAMGALGLEADQVTEFTDVLAVTMTKSNTDVAQLGEAFKYVTPLAGALGFNMQDLGVALGLMANQGIKGSQAGTTLRSALTNLVNPTSSMAEWMERLGIEVENADGSMKPLGEIMDILRDKMGTMTEAEKEASLQMLELSDSGELAQEAMAGLTEEEIQMTTAIGIGTEAIAHLTDAEVEMQLATQLSADEIAQMTDEQKRETLALQEGTIALDGLTQAEQAQASATIFGKQALSGMLAIINTSEEEYNELTEAIYNAEGATNALYETQQDNLKGDWAKFQSALQELGLKIYEILVPALRELVQRLTGVVEWLQNLDEGTIKTIIKIAGIVAAIGPVLVVFGKLITTGTKIIGVLNNLKNIFNVVKIALGGLTGPILAVIAGITALIVWYKQLGDRNTELKEKVDGLLKVFVGFIKNGLERIGSAIKPLIDAFKKLWDSLQPIMDILGILIASVLPVVGFLFDVIAGAIAGVIEVVTGVIDVLSGFIDFIIGIFTGDMEKAKDGAERIWEGIKSIFSGAVNAIFGAINDLITNIFNFLKEKGPELLSNIGTFLLELPGKIWNWLLGVLETLGRLTVELFVWIAENLPQWLTDFVSWIAQLPGKLWEKFLEVIGKLGEFAGKLFAWVAENIPEFVTKIVTKIGELPGKIWEKLKQVIEKVATWGAQMLAKGVKASADVVAGIINKFREAPKQIVEVGKNLLKGLWDGILSMKDWVINKVKGLVGDIVGGFKSFLGIASPSKVLRDAVGKFIPQGIAVGIEQESQTVDHALSVTTGNSIANLADNLKHTIAPITDLISDSLNSVSLSNDILNNNRDSINGSLLDTGTVTGTGHSTESIINNTSNDQIHIEIIARDQDDVDNISQKLQDEVALRKASLGRSNKFKGG